MATRCTDPSSPHTSEELYKMYLERRVMREKKGMVRLPAETDGEVHYEVCKDQ